MSTVLKVNPDNPSPHAIAQAVDVLRAGGVIAYPTDTVYGLGANALTPHAIHKIFTVKQRPWDQPLPVAVSGRRMAADVAYIDDRAARVIDQFWPGALTLVLPKTPRLPPVVTGGHTGVGVRAPDHPVPLALLASAQLPLIATSANKHGSPPCIDAQEVLNHFDGEIDLILDGGTCNTTVSTVLDLTEEPPRLLRQGAVPRKRIEAALGVVEDASSVLK
jgi:L-threonylcarbamoyladenylate synthase